jgi:hypothetical protein
MIWTTFNLTDSEGNELYTTLHISPSWSGFAYDGTIVTSDTICAKEQYGSVSLPLVPNSYVVQAFGRNSSTRFYIALPLTIDNTTASAVDYITMSACDYIPSSSYAVTASYALNGGGGGSGSGFPYVTASNLAGAQPPIPPGPQLYQDTSNGQMWFYNVAAPAWVPLFTV